MLLVEIYRRLVNLILASTFLLSIVVLPILSLLLYSYHVYHLCLTFYPCFPYGCSNGARAHARTRLHMQSHLDDRTCRWFNDLSPTLSIYRRWRPRLYARKLAIQCVLIVSTHRAHCIGLSNDSVFALTAERLLRTLLTNNLKFKITASLRLIVIACTTKISIRFDILPALMRYNPSNVRRDRIESWSAWFTIPLYFHRSSEKKQF